MASLSKTLVDNTQNASADSDFQFENTIYIGSNSVRPNSRSVIRFTNMTIERAAQIGAANLDLYLAGAATTGTAPNIRVRLALVANPGMPGTGSALRSLSKTVASTVKTIALNAAEGYYRFDFKAALQEVVNLSNWKSGNAIVLTLSADPESGRIVRFRDVAWAANPPAISVTYTNPVPVSAQGTLTFPALQIIAQGVMGTGPVTAEGVLTFPALEILAEAKTFIPNPVAAQAVMLFPPLEIVAAGGIGDARKNTIFSFERRSYDTHYFVTEEGLVFGFASRYDTVLGGVRDAMMGQADDAWAPEAGKRTRVAASLPFSATLPERQQARRDTDVLERELANVREIHHPDGRIFDVTEVLLRARPAADVLEVTALTKGAFQRDPLLSGTLSAVFGTRDSTPELPVFAVDAGGSITAPLRAAQVDRGALALGVRFEERGMLPLASVGRPVEGDGSSHASSVTMSYQDRHLHVSVRGELTRIRESQLGPFGADLVLWLYWTSFRAHLLSCSPIGVRTFDVAAGPPTELSEKILTAGVDANGLGLGAFLAPGSASFGVPFFSFYTPPVDRLAAAAQAYYDELSEPGRSWEIVPPDYSLELSRDDSKPLELAPGESLTFDFSVRRVGGYTGPLSVPAPIVSGGLTSSVATLSQSGTVDHYRATITAPAGTTEGTYTLRLEAKATGADTPGSILTDVRDSFDATLEVAASPVIMPNATFNLQCNDPVLHRPGELLRDASGEGSAFSWNGYARGNRLGRGVLATGVGEAAIYSAPLTNADMPQRMSAQQTFSMILRQVEKTSTSNGVVFQLAADVTTGTVADGVWLLRVPGGFTIRTLFGSSVVTSPDVLAWSSGDAELGLVVTSTAVMLINRANMRSIWLPRPAWADTGVRVCWGAVRTPSGSFTNLTRVHLMTASGHPYALSDIQLRRNIDKLRESAPASDGKPEYPDNTVGIFRWDEASGKYQNRAAIALAIAMTPTGSVGTPSGAVSTPGNTTAYVFSGREFLTSGILTVITSVGNFADAEAYNCNFGVSAAGSNIMAVEVGNRYDGKPRLRHQNGGDAGGNAEWAQRDLDKTPAAAVMNFALEVSNSGATSKLTSLDTGQTTTASGTAANGSLGVSIGAIIRASGSPVEGQKALNREMVICRGSVPAQALQDTKVLMAT